MVNFNGMLYGDDAHFISHRNRGLRYGDALFEIARVLGGKIVFWEDHYLRLMSSMRLMRMEIPMNFTMEYLEAQIGATLEANALQNSAASVRLTIFRKGWETSFRNRAKYHGIWKSNNLIPLTMYWTKKPLR